MTELESAMSKVGVYPPDARDEACGCDWTPSLAECLARIFGMAPLSELHWRVISECREEWARSGIAPGLERLASVSHLSAAEFQALFPRDLRAFPWILAGVMPPSSLWAEASGTPESRRERTSAPYPGFLEALAGQSGLNGNPTAIPADFLPRPAIDLAVPSVLSQKGAGK